MGGRDELEGRGREREIERERERERENIAQFCPCRIVSSCLQLLVHDMETACTAAFNAMVKVSRQLCLVEIL